MKVARITRTSVPHLINGGVGSTNVGLSGGSSGQVITSNGSNGYYWGENVARITANSSNIATGPFVNFAAGSNIILAVSSNTINIASTGGSGTNLTVEEVDGSPSVAATKLVLPNGTVGVVGTVATYTPTGGSAGALVFLESHAASASATLDFTTFISSTYDEYVFEIISLVPASNSDLWIRMGTGGGPTYDTGANYGYTQFVFRAGGSGASGVEGGGTKISASYTGGGNINVGTAAQAAVQGTVRLFDPQSTALYKLMLGHLDYFDTGNFRLFDNFRGSYESTTAVTAIRFLMSTGNITSGTIRVYGVAKS